MAPRKRDAPAALARTATLRPRQRGQQGGQPLRPRPQGGQPLRARQQDGQHLAQGGQPLRRAMAPQGGQPLRAAMRRQDGQHPLARQDGGQPLLPITLGTDCSGRESFAEALENLKVRFAHKFASDNHWPCKAVILHNWKPEAFYDDVNDRAIACMPAVDLYAAGVPCQPFSTAGRQRGAQDPRGRLLLRILDYLKHHMPKAVVLENVKGFLSTRHAKFRTKIFRRLRSITKTGCVYNMHVKLINTFHHGLAQHRERCYIVLIRSDVDNGTFCWPRRKRCKPLDETLKTARRRRGMNLNGIRAARPMQPTARRKLCHALREIQAAGIDPFSNTFVVDVDSRVGHYCYKKCPCITATRAATGGFWVTTLGQKTTLADMERLQGMSPARTKIPPGVSVRQMGHMTGNAMSVNVLQQILKPLLRASGLWRRDGG